MTKEIQNTESNIGSLFLELLGARIPSWKYIISYLVVFAAMFFFFWDSFVFSTTVYLVAFVVLSIWSYSSGNSLLRIIGVTALYVYIYWLFGPVKFASAMFAVCLIRTFLHAVSTSDNN